MTISGRVAQVISPFEVAFNIGSNDGVREGDIATLYRVITVEDPESKEPLGKVRRPTIRFRIIEVQPQLSVGETFEREGSALDALTLSLSDPDATRKRVTTDKANTDRKTTLVKLGQSVTVHHPKKKASGGGSRSSSHS